MNKNPPIPNDKLLDLLLDVVCVVDIEGRFLSVSAASERVFGYRPDEMIGRSVFEFIHPDDHSITRTVVERINSGQPSTDHENRYVHKDGHIVQIMWATQWLEEEQVRIGVARDITERKQMYSRLEYLAQHDQLTELPNRALFLDRLQIALKKAARDSTKLAVLYLDMDRFKEINDTFGHTTGDHLLREVAHRLIRSVRDSDTIGRLGGDEFAVLLDGISEPTDATVVADKIIATLSEPYNVDGETLNTAPSLGIAIYPEHGHDDLHLIRHADDAMYVAKRDGGKRYSMGQARRGKQRHPSPDLL
ncbi:diguanylate cyclase [Marinobacter sp. HL-58]|uniref:diguanylate cyclase domain-containing protein n=1 Tax=Marinobacter sp. HL-58 TaxID=1479237 RepID=UPI0006893E5D|nr:diguanylate cyclase [Marinobacter sp. HL-58]